MADNKQLKDGLGNLFTLRMKDVSPGLDGTLQRSLFFATPYPLEYAGGGIYQHRAKSGTLLTGLPVNSPIYSFWWPITVMLAAVTRIRFSAWSTTTFAGGIAQFDVYAARNFSVADSGGIVADLTGNNSKLRTSMGSSEANIRWSSNAAITPGTRTLDAAPFDGRIMAVPTAANGLFVPGGPATLFEKQEGEHPLLLQSFEGFVIHASVPSDGAWQFIITVDWAEVPHY
jgi:hypothetical protein